MMNVVVHACYLYPVKSCAGVPVSGLCFDESGQIVGDRQWVVVDERRGTTWMGAIPQLALVRPQLVSDGCLLRTPAGQSVALPPPGEGSPCAVQAWNSARGGFDTLEGRDAGDAAAELLSDVTGSKLRVVWLAGHGHRPNPVHLTTTASLHRLATQSGTDEGELAACRRFRPNVVLAAAPGQALEAFAEERAVAFTQALLHLEVTARCARCIMVDVDPDAGEMSGRWFEATKEHSARRYPGEPAYFGIYAQARGPGFLAVGQPLTMETGLP